MTKDKLINLNKTDVLLRICGEWYLRTFRPITKDEAMKVYWEHKDKEVNKNGI